MFCTYDYSGVGGHTPDICRTQPSGAGWIIGSALQWLALLLVIGAVIWIFAALRARTLRRAFANELA